MLPQCYGKVSSLDGKGSEFWDIGSVVDNNGEYIID